MTDTKGGNLKCQLTHSQFYVLARWMEQNKGGITGQPAKYALKLAQQEIPFPITETHIRTGAKAANIKLGVEPRQVNSSDTKVLADALVEIYMSLGMDIPANLLDIATPLKASLKQHS